MNGPATPPPRKTLVDDAQAAVLAYLAKMHEVAGIQTSSARGGYAAGRPVSPSAVPRGRFASRSAAERPPISALRDMIARIDEVLADKSRVRQGEWCTFERVTGTPVIPDLTGGYWPDHICNKRNRFWIELVDALPAFHVFPDGSTSLESTVTCTRIAGHTGRHAAGDGEHIVAVWGDRP